MTEHFEWAAHIEQAVASVDLTKDWDLHVEIRPRRSTLGLELKPGEPVRVLVPPHATPEQVADFVRRYQSWLARNIPEARQLAPDFAIKEFVDGEEFDLLGRTYRLRLTEGGTPARTERVVHALGATDFLYIPHTRLEAPRHAMITLYSDRGVAWTREHGEPYERRGAIQGVRYEVRSLGSRRWAPTAATTPCHREVAASDQRRSHSRAVRGASPIRYRHGRRDDADRPVNLRVPARTPSQAHCRPNRRLPHLQRPPGQSPRRIRPRTARRPPYRLTRTPHSVRGTPCCGTATFCWGTSPRWRPTRGAGDGF
ncbi:YgjP-like metallopeptidase domain-containing protein [Saccharopolyspora sp. NPDC050389]|uniref:YgjP-like metallopeptidase domain-containing protein n=1 Tax=Saccharopolyspora sp. NPDC050389 TaxID=3155516 RepID=UPI0033FA3929